jgi:hypothetical protein
VGDDFEFDEAGRCYASFQYPWFWTVSATCPVIGLIKDLAEEHSGRLPDSPGFDAGLNPWNCRLLV